MNRAWEGIVRKRKREVVIVLKRDRTSMGEQERGRGLERVDNKSENGRR